MIDPGPASEAHVGALAEALRDADSVVIALTHGHADHSGAAQALADRLGAEIVGACGPAEGEGGGGAPHDLRVRPLRDGEAVGTDAGELIALRTPGHARAHLCFHWREASAVFVGDLLLGRGETTWVGEYPGCVRDYLDSLDRIQGVGAAVLLPAHGPAIADPLERIARFRAHRVARIAAVARALATRPDADVDALLHEIHPSIPPDVAPAARASVAALIAHVRSG